MIVDAFPSGSDFGSEVNGVDVGERKVVRRR